MYDQNSLKEQILKLTDNGFDIYRKLISSDIKLGRPVKSPLREERHPSFSVYVHKTRGDIWYKDFPESGKAFYGDCFNFVKTYRNLNDFKDVIKAIKQEVLGIYDDSPLVLQNIAKKAPRPKIQTVDKTKFIRTPRDWNNFDLKYFHKFLIHQEILDQFKVYPVTEYTSIKGEEVRHYKESPYDPIYFVDFVTGNNKVYRPMTSFRPMKWRSNTDAERDIFGIHLLTKPVDDLFLLAGQKDTMSFWATTGIPCVALAAEGTLMHERIMLKLESIAKRIHVLYDNDDAGFKNANRLFLENGYPYYNDLIKKYDVNDYAQLVDERREFLPEFFKLLRQQMAKNSAKKIFK